MPEHHRERRTARPCGRGLILRSPAPSDRRQLGQHRLERVACPSCTRASPARGLRPAARAAARRPRGAGAEVLGREDRFRQTLQRVTAQPLRGARERHERRLQAGQRGGHRGDRAGRRASPPRAPGPSSAARRRARRARARDRDHPSRSGRVHRRCEAWGHEFGQWRHGRDAGGRVGSITMGSRVHDVAVIAPRRPADARRCWFARWFTAADRGVKSAGPMRSRRSAATKTSASHSIRSRSSFAAAFAISRSPGSRSRSSCLASASVMIASRDQAHSPHRSRTHHRDSSCSCQSTGFTTDEPQIAQPMSRPCARSRRRRRAGAVPGCAGGVA